MEVDSNHLTLDTAIRLWQNLEPLYPRLGEFISSVMDSNGRQAEYPTGWSAEESVRLENSSDSDIRTTTLPKQSPAVGLAPVTQQFSVIVGNAAPERPRVSVKTAVPQGSHVVKPERSQPQPTGKTQIFKPINGTTSSIGWIWQRRYYFVVPLSMAILTTLYLINKDHSVLSIEVPIPSIEGKLSEVSPNSPVIIVGNCKVHLYGIGPISVEGKRDLFKLLGETMNQVSCQPVLELKDQYRCYTKTKKDLARIILRIGAAKTTPDAPNEYKEDEKIAKKLNLI